MKNIDIQFLQAEVSRISDWIRASDRKTAFLSIYYTFSLGIIFGFSGFSRNEIVLCMQIVALLISTAGLIFLFLSIFPRTKNKLTNESLFYFGCIASMKFKDFQSKFEKLKDEDIKSELVEQIYTLSGVADAKMKNIQWSTKLLFPLLTLVFLITILA